MHYVTVTGHSPSDGVHKKLRHTPRHVSGRLSSFCFFTDKPNQPAQNNFDTHQSVTDLAGVGTRLYDSPVRAELYGYTTNNVAWRQTPETVYMIHDNMDIHNLIIIFKPTIQLWISIIFPAYRSGYP